MMLVSRMTLPFTEVHLLTVLFGLAQRVQVFFGEALGERQQATAVGHLPLSQSSRKIEHSTLVFDLEFVELL